MSKKSYRHQFSILVSRVSIVLSFPASLSAEWKRGKKIAIAGPSEIRAGEISDLKALTLTLNMYKDETNKFFSKAVSCLPDYSFTLSPHG
jgi:hypothetical protein